MGDRAEHMEHELAGGRGSVEAFLETHEVDALGLEGVDGLEEFTQRAAEPVEADDAEAIARSGVVDELGEPRGGQSAFRRRRR